MTCFCVNLFMKKLKYNLGRVRRISGIVQYYSCTWQQDLIILLVRLMFALKGLSKPNMKSKQGLKRVYVIKWITKGNRSIWDVACVASKYWSMGLKCKCNLTEIIAEIIVLVVKKSSNHFQKVVAQNGKFLWAYQMYSWLMTGKNLK